MVGSSRTQRASGYNRHTTIKGNRYCGNAMRPAPLCMFPFEISLFAPLIDPVLNHLQMATVTVFQILGSENVDHRDIHPIRDLTSKKR
jgi:hypothetical protein